MLRNYIKKPAKYIHYKPGEKKAKKMLEINKKNGIPYQAQIDLAMDFYLKKYEKKS